MKDFRKTKPMIKGDILFSLPNIEEDYLHNGIRLLYVQKHNLPITKFQVLIESGSSYDPDNKHGLSYLTSMLLDEGAAEYNSLQLSDEIEKIGSIFSISSDRDSIYASMLSMTDYLERSIELLSKIISTPNFEQSDFERERTKLLTKIIQTEDNPSQLANNIFDKLVYGNSYYAHPVIGIKDTVETLVHNDVTAYYFNKALKSKITIAVVGSEAKDKVLELFNKHLTFKREEPFITQSKIANIISEQTKIYLIDSPEAPQSEIRIGHITNKRTNGNYFSKYIMNAILGGQFSSRINLNLREDKGYTYGASSYFNYNKMAGDFTVSTSVQSEVTTESVSEIMKELKLIHNGAEQSELDFAKSYLTKRYPAMFETYMQVANNLGAMILYDLEKSYFNSYLNNLNEVTLEDVNNAAIKYIHPDNSTILINGSKDELLPKLSDNFNYEICVLDKKGNIIS